MALDNNPVFTQEPKTASIAFAAGSDSTQMDPATVAPTTLLTAGADGAIVTSVKAFAEVSVTAEKFVLWIRHLGAGNWYPVNNVLMSAYTMAGTTAQGDTLLVDKDIETQHIRLQATDVLGVTHHVDQQTMITAEFTDY